MELFQPDSWISAISHGNIVMQMSGRLKTAIVNNFTEPPLSSFIFDTVIFSTYWGKIKHIRSWRYPQDSYLIYNNKSSVLVNITLIGLNNCSSELASIQLSFKFHSKMVNFHIAGELFIHCMCEKRNQFLWSIFRYYHLSIKEWCHKLEHFKYCFFSHLYLHHVF